ncbi:MAG: hypothetical protein HC764_18455 [Pleurocapsa sp. CRU_1_2]|nr:hypothetical protein [Pleurocapsa sp. CRU_1_2]
MSPEREFLIVILSHYLKHHPNKAKDQAIDFCTKYLIQQDQTIRLAEHANLLESRLDEIQIDYQILRIELEREQQKNLSLNRQRQSVELPGFLFSANRHYSKSS